MHVADPGLNSQQHIWSVSMVHEQSQEQLLSTARCGPFNRRLNNVLRAVRKSGQPGLELRACGSVLFLTTALSPFLRYMKHLIS